MNSNILVSSVFANIRYYALRGNGLTLSLSFCKCMAYTLNAEIYEGETSEID